VGTFAYWANWVAPAISTVAVVVILAGLVLSWAGVSVGDNFWKRIEHVRQSNYTWSRLSWGVTNILKGSTVFIWFAILIATVAFALDPNKWIKDLLGGHPLPPGLAAPVFTPVDLSLFALFGKGLGLAFVAAMAIGLVNGILELFNFYRKYEDIVDRYSDIAVSIVFFVFCVFIVFLALREHVDIAYRLLPAVAGQITSHYESVKYTQVLAFGVVSMSYYPLPAVATGLTAVLITNGIETVRGWIGGDQKPGPVLLAIERFGGWATMFFALAVPGAIASIFWTLLMLVFGNYVQQEAVNVSLQLLVSNAVFDGITVYVSIVVLTWAARQYRIHDRIRNVEENMQYVQKHIQQVERSGSEEIVRRRELRYRWHTVSVFVRLIAFVGPKNIKRVAPDFALPQFEESEEGEYAYSSWIIDNIDTWKPVFVKIADAEAWRALPGFLVNLLLAATFACAALFFALWRTPAEISFAHTLWIFAGGFNGHAFTELGPLFWVTHSTFLPTILLWIVILYFYIAAYLIEPFGNYVAKLGRATLTDPKAGLLKYGVSLLTVGGVVEQVMKVVLGVIRRGAP
jgi:hypothetical protein